MKKTILILGFLVFVCSPGILKSQIKVKSDGRVYINGFRSGDDYNNECSMQVYGKIGSNLAGGRIGFGDYGSTAGNGANVFIGEYGNTDSDILQLHGKSGIYLTYNAGSTLGYYNVSSNIFYFTSDVYSKGIKLMSDERFKKNILNISNSLDKVKKINGVSYNFDSKSIYNHFNKNVINDSSKYIQNDGKKNAKYFEDSIKDNYRKLGFIAQNLKDVFPELVDIDSNGYYYVDYIGLIPVLVEAIKEQQITIENQEYRITAIESRLNNEDITNDYASKLNNKTINDNLLKNKSTKLYQNVPNPFSTETSIQYSIPIDSKNAKICVFNLNGSLILTKTISQNGDGTVKIAARELTPGMYLYSLILDGNIIETKRMILTD